MPCMTRAVLDGEVVAESDDVKIIEGMVYFPLSSVNMDLLVESSTTTRCFWKGKASYWHITTDDDLVPDGAFTYERPWPLARKLVTDRVAFWRGVEIHHD